MRYLALFLILAAVLIAGFFWTTHKASAPVPEGAVMEGERTFSWRFARNESPDGLLPPRTSVALITNGAVYDLGHYAGSCSEIAAENLLENEAAAVLCWWAGGGDEIGVFKDGERFVVRHGLQDEGSAEEPGSRGSFTDLVELR